MIRRFPVSRTAALTTLAALLAGCALPAPYSPPAPPPPAAPAVPPAVAGSGPEITEPAPPEVAPPSIPTPAPVPRERALNPAARTLLSQAQSQAAQGNYPVAAANLERALRIEPDSPQLWIELGRIRLAEGNAAQAENMGRKALSLSTGNPRSQSASWRLIADSLRARRRVQEAREADARAEALVAN